MYLFYHFAWIAHLQEFWSATFNLSKYIQKRFPNPSNAQQLACPFTHAVWSVSMVFPGYWVAWENKSWNFGSGYFNSEKSFRFWLIGEPWCQKLLQVQRHNKQIYRCQIGPDWPVSWSGTVVLPKSGLVWFLGKICECQAEHRFRFSHMVEHWTKHTWMHSEGSVCVPTKFKHRTCPKMNKNNKY
jgi:hypothetical protein